ncbi:unnamed protein product, partial [Ectocarpus sp. 4 AP-2014]
MFRPWNGGAGRTQASGHQQQTGSKPMERPGGRPRQQRASSIPPVGAPAPAAAPPQDPFRTKRQLPRTPLSSKTGNRLPGSRARASPSVTKVPRSSHFARSASPARSPPAAGVSTPTGSDSSGAAAAAGRGGGAVGEIVTTPAADTKRIEEEMLAAFARTPKVARTPPKGSTPQGGQEAAGGERPAPRLSAKPPEPAAFGGQPGGFGQQHPNGSRIPPQAEAEAEAGRVPDEDPPRRPAAAEPAFESVFGGRAKVARTPPRRVDAALSTEKEGAAGAGQQAAANPEGGYSGLNGGGGSNGRQEEEEGESKAGLNDAKESQRQQQRSGFGIPSAAAAAHAPLPAAPERAGVRDAATGGSLSRLASPSVSTDGSFANAANVRSLAGSSSKAPDVAGGSGFCGALTPAAFKGLTSAMRTPSTGMERGGAPANEVPQMKSLDAAVAPTAHHKPAPRGPSAARAMNRVAPPRPRYASSVAEAKAAAEAAAAATAARRAKAAAAIATAAAAAAEAGPTARDTEPITSSGGPLAAAAAAGPTVSITEPNTSSADTSGPPASLSALPPSEAVPAAERGEALGGAGGMVSPSTLGEADPGPVASHTVPTAQEGVTAGPGESGNGRNDAELDVDPFVRSRKIARTPTRGPAAGAVPRGVSPATDVAETAVADETAAAGVTATHGVVAGGTQDGDSDAVSGTESRSEEATQKVGVEGEGSPEAPAGDPFASRSNIPRTPTDQVAPPRESLAQERGERGDAGPMGEGEARLRIGELHQELACMTDRLTKQAEERNRLADVAFEAQDEAIKLRQQLEDFQQRERQNGGDGAPSDETSGSNGEGGGASGEGGTAGRAEDETDARVLQLEIEKLETEQSKVEAEREAQRAAEEARRAKAALDEARAKVRELTLSAEAQREKMLEEKLRRDRERCKQDERAIEEHQIKVKLFIANKRAEILRAQASEEERLRAEQVVRSAAVAVAGRAFEVVRELVARNARMSRRVAGLRAIVEERQRRVSELKGRSALLEASGRSAQDEAEAVREQLARAMEDLEAAKESSGELEARLGPLEKECQEAHTAQERLR